MSTPGLFLNNESNTQESEKADKRSLRSRSLVSPKVKKIISLRKYVSK